MAADDEESSISRDLESRAAPAFDRVVGNLVNAGVTGWLTHATGSAESAAALGGMAGPLSEELSFAVRRVLNVRQKRAETVVDAAASRSGRTVDELLAEISGDAAKAELLLRTLEAAARSTAQAKLDVLAEIFALGMTSQDRAIVDEQIIAVDALTSLEAPHMRLMRVLMDASPEWWETAELRRELRYSWPEARILEKDPGIEAALPALLAKVQSLGLIRDTGAGRLDYRPLWELTSFGRICIRALALRTIESIADEAPPPRFE